MKRSLACIACIFGISPLAAANEESIFLELVKVDDPNGVSLSDLQELRLHTKNAVDLAATLEGWSPEVKGNAVRVRPRGRPLAFDVPTAQHRGASFLIDYKEPVFETLLEEVRTKLGPSPRAGALRDFVSNLISPGGNRGFDPASRVMALRRGDCTEYAVALTALLRAHKIPARVVLGVALVQRKPGQNLAAGHAWTEFWRKGAWHRIDASPLGKGNSILAVPVVRVASEGPGYGFDLAGAIAAMPTRIEMR